MQLPFSESERTENSTRAYRLIRGNNVTVLADPRVLASLDATIQEAIRTTLRPGVEAGGFLIGELEPWIQINDFEMLEIEYLFDPSVQLSAPGLLRFRRALVDRQKPVIGLFRSHTNGEPDTTQADNVIAGLFGDLLDIPDPVLLLLPASRSGLEEARLYRRVDNIWAQVVRFPLVAQGVIGETDDATTTPHPPAVIPQRNPPQQLAPEPDRVEPVSKPPASVPSANRRIESKVLWATVGVVAAAMALAYFSGFSRPSTVTSSSAELGLAVQQLETGLQVRWNRQSPDVLRAVSGVLKIQDGEKRLTIPLAREVLRNGSAFYIAESSKVDVWLEVYQDEHHSRSEGATTSVTRTPDLSQPDLNRKVQPGTGIVEAEAREPASPPLVASRQRPLRIPALQVNKKPNPGKVEVNVVTVIPPKPFIPVPSAQREPHGTADRTNASLPLPPQLSQALPSSPPDPPVSLPDILLPPVAFTPTPPISYVAATPVRKIRPAIPTNLRSAIQSLVSVQVKVVVDSAGKVVSAAPAATSTTAQKLLAPQAAQAALLWQFEPARRNGVPVYSESVLTFEFERPSR